MSFLNSSAGCNFCRWMRCRTVCNNRFRRLIELSRLFNWATFKVNVVFAFSIFKVNVICFFYFNIGLEPRRCCRHPPNSTVTYIQIKPSDTNWTIVFFEAIWAPKLWKILYLTASFAVVNPRNALLYGICQVFARMINGRNNWPNAYEYILQVITLTDDECGATSCLVWVCKDFNSFICWKPLWRLSPSLPSLKYKNLLSGNVF